MVTSGRHGAYFSAMRAIDIRSRVDSASVLKDLIVHVRSCRPARASHQRDDISSADQITDLNDVFLIVGIASAETIPMRNLDHHPVAGAVTTPAHYAAGNGPNS